jgi:A/G-specific adenine glycosylase
MTGTQFKHSAHGMINITRRLLDWYGKNRRDLPWRKTRDPYAIWVSEIMLQQTQVDTVIPYYRRFMRRYPTVRRLARASRDEVLKAWENMGYYSRARHLHEAAVILARDHAGKLPETSEGLRSLPGIGSYTAGAVLSIAFDKPVPAVDGNVRRVMSRLLALRKPLRDASVQKKIERAVEALIPKDRPGQFNQALMDLGATVCLPRNPDCGRCPLAGVCLARIRGLQNSIPAVPKRAALPHRDVTAAIIRKNGRVLVVRRPEKGLLGGLWKFPGGQRENGKSLRQSLRQSMLRELGMEVAVGPRLLSVDHGYSHFLVTLHAFDCRHLKGSPENRDCAGWAWAPIGKLGDLAFSKADREIARGILESMSEKTAGKGNRKQRRGTP